jgi:hypothetical protein
MTVATAHGSTWNSGSLGSLLKFTNETADLQTEFDEAVLIGAETEEFLDAPDPEPSLFNRLFLGFIHRSFFFRRVRRMTTQEETRSCLHQKRLAASGSST